MCIRDREGPLASLKNLKIDMDWLFTNPGLLARAIEDASPVRRKVEEVDVSDLGSLSTLLIDKMGPPSFKEDLVSRIKGADKAQVAADALVGMTAIISPTALLGVGLKYAAKFLSLVRERRKEEYKSFLEMWRKNVEEGFSEENLSLLIGEDGLKGLLEVLQARKLAVVIHDVIRTPYELFLPLLICNLADEVGEALVIIDGASHLARFSWSMETLSSLPGEHPGLKLACLIHTGPELAYEKLPELVRSFSGRRAVIFDMEPGYIDVLCRGKPASFKAALLRGLEEAAKERLSGNLAFLLYDSISEPLPKLIKVGPGKLGRLKGALGALLRRIKK